jgi:hypothetical protein
LVGRCPEAASGRRKAGLEIPTGSRARKKHSELRGAIGGIDFCDLFVTLITAT